MNEHLKPALAEWVGTFTLVFIGAGGNQRRRFPEGAAKSREAALA